MSLDQLLYGGVIPVPQTEGFHLSGMSMTPEKRKFTRKFMYIFLTLHNLNLMC